MSITITGGFTSTGGGFTLVAAPSTPTAGWFIGGNPPANPASSLIDRITYATDTTTASVRGPLSPGVRFTSATGTNTYGWIASGTTGTAKISTIQRITYANDSATTSARGTMTYPNYFNGASTDSTTYGWWGGGYGGNGPGWMSSVDRVTYATDTGTASLRGPLSSARYGLSAVSNTQYGWFGGGNSNASPNYFSIIDRITYATDTATASVRGPLFSLGRSFGVSSDGSNYGYFVAGDGQTVNLSSVQRITYATDTATASIRGSYILSIYSLAGSGNDTYGYFGGGSGPISSVGRITYATDTATATTKGPLSAARYSLGSSAGIQ